MIIITFYMEYGMISNKQITFIFLLSIRRFWPAQVPEYEPHNHIDDASYILNNLICNCSYASLSSRQSHTKFFIIFLEADKRCSYALIVLVVAFEEVLDDVNRKKEWIGK